MSEASSMDCRVGPRVRTVFQDDDSGHYRYRRHEVEISYIVVTAPNGVRAYDGWWYAGRGKTHREALMEALHGAMLWPNAEITGLSG